VNPGKLDIASFSVRQPCARISCRVMTLTAAATSPCSCGYFDAPVTSICIRSSSRNASRPAACAELAANAATVNTTAHMVR
jgi:hypothetical protein